MASTVLPALTPDVSVEVLARDGSLLRAFTVADGRWRLATSVDDVDPTYVNLLLAYEDRRFYQHSGVDVLAIARAAWQAVTTGRPVSGASTITMQVARLLEGGGTGSWSGKVRQVRVALALERVLSKEEVLGLYLELAPMGGNLEGVRAGSFAWFGREPARLTPAQAALLVALPQSPATRVPDEHPAGALVARRRVLETAERQGVIGADDLAAALGEPLPTARRPFPSLAPHLADRLRAEDPDALVHLTTIDADLQAALEQLTASALVQLPSRATVAALVADERTGEVVASVGSADYTSTARQGYVDMTRAVRSPGSALKPLVYGLAFARGVAHPETIVDDRPTTFGDYAPQNFDGWFRGPVTAREALQASLNLPVVALTEALGPATLLASLRTAMQEVVVPGDEAGLALALGGVGVTLEGLVQLYAAIARGGTVQPLTVTPLTGSAGRGAELLPAPAAWLVADVLAGAPRPAGSPDRQLAFKTGTSSGNRDALALGFDGAHVVGVWVGRADGSPVPGMMGADVALPLLFEAFDLLGKAAPLPRAPVGTVVVSSTRELPPHLRRFGTRAEGAPAAASEGPKVAFPPDGAVLAPLQAGLAARVERGVAPFAWFVNGAPVVLGSYEREERLLLDGPGFVTLSVVDAAGRAARVSIELQ